MLVDWTFLTTARHANLLGRLHVVTRVLFLVGVRTRVDGVGPHIEDGHEPVLPLQAVLAHDSEKLQISE